MKPFPLSLIFVFLLFALAKSTSSLTPGFLPWEWNFGRKLDVQEMKHLAAKWITEVLTKSLTITPAAKNAKMPLLPDLLDPFPIEHELINLESEMLTGSLNFTEGNLTGLSTVKHNFDVNLIVMKITYMATAEKLVLKAQYSVDGFSHIPESLIEFNGAGCLLVSVLQPEVNLEIGFSVELRTQEVTATDVSLDVGFKSLHIDLENFTVCDKLVEDWEKINDKLKPLFDKFWDMNRDSFGDNLTEIINSRFLTCEVRLTDLIHRNFTESCPQRSPSTTEASSTEPSEDYDLLEEFVEMVVQHFVSFLAPQVACDFGTSTTPSSDGEGKSAAALLITMTAVMTFICAQRI